MKDQKSRRVSKQENLSGTLVEEIFIHIIFRIMLKGSRALDGYGAPSRVELPATRNNFKSHARGYRCCVQEVLVFTGVLCTGSRDKRRGSLSEKKKRALNRPHLWRGVESVSRLILALQSSSLL